MQTTHRCLASYIVLVMLLAIVGSVGCGQSDEDTQDKGASIAGQSDGGQEASRAKDQTNDPKHPVVKITTSLGDIRVKLDREKAPLTVDNFLQYADEKYYDGMIFHEVTPGYAIVGGTYTKDLAIKPTEVAVYNEAHNGLKNVRGTIAMAREPDTSDSATSGFFINLTENSHMDHQDDTHEGYGYCVFGEVIEGMDIADRIGKVELHEVTAKDGSSFGRVPVEPVVIRSIRVDD